jgi:hypothetical protein
MPLDYYSQLTYGRHALKQHAQKQHAVTILSTVLLLICTSSNAQSTRGLTLISSQQVAKIQAALQVTTANAEMDRAVAEAASTIGSFIKTNACLSGYDGSALNVFAAPGKSYPNNNYSGPMPTMYKHNKSSCATVLRVHGWSMPTRNSLRFEVVYVAEDSGESSKAAHEVVKQASGEWLFSR